MFELDSGETVECGCELSREAGTLVVSADGCPGGGRLATEPDCRATVVRAVDGTVERLRVETGEAERRYGEGAVALLDAARRFADRIEDVDASLAGRARRDPLGAAGAAAGRGPESRVGRAVAESGLALCADRVAGAAEPYAAALEPEVRPALPAATVSRRPPAGATFLDRRSLPTGAVVRRYRTAEGPLYHLEPVEYRFGPAARVVLADARTRLAGAADEGGATGEMTGRSPVADAGTGGAVGRAASEAVAAGDADVEAGRIAAVLRRHTSGLGVVEDVLADPSVSDVFASAPVESTSCASASGGRRCRRTSASGVRGRRRSSPISGGRAAGRSPGPRPRWTRRSPSAAAACGWRP